MIYFTLNNYDFPAKLFVRHSVKLHIKALSYRSFLTSLGEGFLCNLYRGIVAKNGFIICAVEKGKLRGFLLFSYSPTKVMKYWRVVLNLICLLWRVDVLKKVVQLALFSQKEEELPELLVIAVEEEYRSKGIGSEMFRKMFRIIKANFETNFRVVVHKEIARSNNFYFKNGLKLYKTYTLCGVEWNEWRLR